ncbi:ABATE domain-containing protein [Streptomyces peucetius]|uniref:ABATE domain-containing protein n=1 Tax=Streptomyces peucetius TaxID=1950 RepID=A0ABY6I014_STRPE|nr:ABATE domain-containing protein [Streptomyces peucetius]UYQ60203.1 ABATE domain-containing protein [Streptomyces peucetius]
MSLKNLHEMPWIGEHAVLDLANTVVCGADSSGGDIDLLAEEGLRASWRSRAADRGLADLPLEELTRLREPARAVLGAAARQAPLPEAARTRLNALAAGAPVTFEVGEDGRLAEREGGGPVAGRVARQVLVLAAGPEQARLRTCPAPSCGMFFLARRRDQAWCSVGCGNRARSARRQALRPD